ncbi:hypothetical protein SAMN02745248_01378 [Hathewaya proteolytica DSM 3090]|uniref:PDZ domain-containing protein n=1 Tax=Hathewaya proteolytica DSM 3090 TaxID=1121331 RepID=A0A1M6NFJ3_9CLOT|nr:PDZ domain-containing protein [Hathewaya proteolytica]SHJ94521.1 hypothetical protein SAMN02745248_01378 [Hathewaya proteolytica DSM 3090]
MESVLQTLRGIAFAITNPYLLLLLFFIGIKLYAGNRRYALMHGIMLGKRVDSPLELTMSQICIGIFCGAVGSIAMNIIGVDFGNRTIIYILFLISILLMNIRPKLICFSYSGSIMGLCFVYLNYIGKTNFNIKSLVVLIGIMHIIEGLLVIIDGGRGAIPVLNNKNGSVIGGFIFNRSWTVPIAFTSAYPFYSVIGYHSVTFTQSKGMKCLVSGSIIGAYGFVVLLMSRFLTANVLLQVLILMVVPLLHESMLLLDNLYEAFRKPIFINEDEGLRVLEVAPNSQGDIMGIESGDVVIEINHHVMDSEKNIVEYLQTLQNEIWLKIKKKRGEVRNIEYDKFNSKIPLGVIFVPRNMKDEESQDKSAKNMGRFRIVLEKVRENYDKTTKEDEKN